MADPPLAPTGCPACDCDDSPLSVVSNILGILTFALGVFAYIAAFIAVTRSATKDIRDTEDVLKAVRRQIDQIARFMELLQNRSDPDLQVMKALVGESLQDFVEAEAEMGRFVLRFKTGAPAADGGEVMVADKSLASRFLWWYYERDKDAGMAKLRGYQQHFAAVQLTFLER